MRATAGLDADNAIGAECFAPDQKLGILTRVNVVGHRRDLIVIAQAFAQRVHQRGLARTYRTADADAQQRFVTHRRIQHIRILAQKRNARAASRAEQACVLGLMQRTRHGERRQTATDIVVLERETLRDRQRQWRGQHA